MRPASLNEQSQNWLFISIISNAPRSPNLHLIWIAGHSSRVQGMHVVLSPWLTSGFGPCESHRSDSPIDESSYFSLVWSQSDVSFQTYRWIKLTISRSPLSFKSKMHIFKRRKTTQSLIQIYKYPASFSWRPFSRCSKCGYWLLNWPLVFFCWRVKCLF